MKNFREPLIAIITVVWILAAIFYVFAGHDIMITNSYPEKKIQVEYVLYTPAGPVEKSGVYMIRGTKAKHVIQSARGSNTLFIEGDADNSGCWFGFREWFSIYEGTSDIDNVRIKFLK